MTPRSDFARIARLRIWVLILTLIPACVFVFFGRWLITAGLVSGGVIVFLNLLGTQRTVSWLIEGEGIERLAAVLAWLGKFGITASVILGLMHFKLADPVALLVGLGTLPLSLVFDIFLFPVNKGEAKKP
ncbi:MAG: ATP synthase subunit I [Pseudomonadota bacterium]|jgi:hypothetical protein